MRLAARLCLLGCALILSSCADGADQDAAVTTAPVRRERCVVYVHGKGETGKETVVLDGVAHISPTGNDELDGDRHQWLYFSDEQYEEAATIVRRAAAGCEQVIVNGFSNGGAFAAKLYCRGEQLDGRLLRVVVDDPVVDQGVLGCAPDPSVDVVLYWTGSLEETAQPGWDCDELVWTCEGGITIGIDAYMAELGAQRQESIHDGHIRYDTTPRVVAVELIDAPDGDLR